MADTITTTSMDVEARPNLRGTNTPGQLQVTLALRDQHTELHMPTIVVSTQDAMDLVRASLVDVDVDEHSNIVAVHINGNEYDVKS